MCAVFKTESWQRWTEDEGPTTPRTDRLIAKSHRLADSLDWRKSSQSLNRLQHCQFYNYKQKCADIYTYMCAHTALVAKLLTLHFTEKSDNSSKHHAHKKKNKKYICI